MKKARSVSSWGKTAILCLLLFSALGVLFIPAQALAYGVEYGVGAAVDNLRDAMFNFKPNQTEGTDYAIVRTDWGAAEASAYVNIQAAKIELYAHSFNSSEPPPNYPPVPINHAASSQSSARFQDTLYFFVPAGVYPEGVTVSTSVYFMGSVSHYGDLTMVTLEFSAKFGDMQVNFFRQSSPDDNLYIYYTLSKKVLPDGWTLTDTSVYDVNVMGYMNLAAVTGGAEGSRAATADFTHSAGFLSVETPEGVTWRSESGVFLSQPIPLPSTLLLLGSGLLGLVGIRKLRKS
jgi:hypothetical protein